MNLHRHLKPVVLVGVLALCAAWAQTATAWAASKTVFGEPRQLGQGTARSLVVLNDRGDPVTIGIAFTRDALSGLPKGQFPPEVMLALPKKAPVPPFTHIVINWNPQGHEPPGIYDVAHFDFHFYTIPNRERVKIKAGDAARFAKAPPAQYLPADYKPAPGGVPRMGAHWIDMTSPEFHGSPFTTTFIYGTYNGAVTFYEPMIAMSFLQEGRNYSSPIKQPTAFKKKGYLPQTYKVIHDGDTGEYRILLDELTRR